VDPKIIQAMVVQMKMNEIAAMRRIKANPPEGCVKQDEACCGPVHK
jgi:hypothetical protein